ncbi:gamma-glutamyltransferase family protein [Corynebacterium nuruki]|uniref:gamma-glutamyltransferase family protein n=1 Tax=Corynebacterium nuruki TaxID=1032851 RepID=UPI0002E15C28
MLRRTRRRTATVAAAAVSAALVLTGCQSPDTADRADPTDTTDAAAGTSAGSTGSSTPAADAPQTSTSCESVSGPAGSAAATATESTAATEPAAPATTSAAPENLATNPETATTGFRTGMTPVKTDHYAVSTANPLSTKAACDVLRDGGTAADALVTAQFVLGLVEPQASGVGGGGYILYNDAKTGKLTSIDGRETAPVAATGTYLSQISREDTSAPTPDARRSGRSIGVPGAVAALGELHDRYGTTGWGDLVAPAEKMADEGFTVSPRLSASIAASADDLSRDREAASYFLDGNGAAKQPGEKLANPAYAATLRSLAAGGADALYTGDLAKDIVDRANSREGGTTPAQLSTADLAAYTPEIHDAVCGPYREKVVCGAGPSSSGGITVLSALGILDHSDLGKYAPTEAGADGFVPDADAVHLISEAERLAYADRDAYVADTAFTPLPGPDGQSADTLLAPDYLKNRAGLIDPDTSMGQADPGRLGLTAARGADQPEHGTSHISVVDREGNAASMTTSVESAFGSFHMVDGFLLNNQLTDFSTDPVDKHGTPVANRVEGAKRPRSSMAPTMVFDTGRDGKRGDLSMVVGSPGGAVIPQFVLKTLIGVIDWGLDPQQAVSMPDFGARNTAETGIGGEHPLIAGADGKPTADTQKLVEALKKKGHEVSTEPQTSGLSAIVRQKDGSLLGGADPRREGVVLGG